MVTRVGALRRLVADGEPPVVRVRQRSLDRRVHINRLAER
jgi:hypothetical protein